MTHVFRAPLRFSAIALLAVGLSGCMMSQPPSRGVGGAQSLMPEAGQSYSVKQVNVLVPRNLVVSEENSYKPAADIVWHGESVGNRYAQVEKLMRDGIGAGARSFQSGRAVILDVQVQRFHALTQKTRDSIGGKHELIYALTVRDAASGEVLRLVPKVNATVRGAGGAAAQAEEAAGRTQAVVIREALANSIQKELSRAGGSGGLFASVTRSTISPAKPAAN